MSIKRKSSENTYKKRDEKTARQFLDAKNDLEKISDDLRKKLKNSDDENKEYLIGKQLDIIKNIRENRELSIAERVAQRKIKESKLKVSSSGAARKYLDEKVIANNFISIKKVRDKLIEYFSSKDDKNYGVEIVDIIFPEPKNPSFIKDLLQHYENVGSFSADEENDDTSDIDSDDD